MADINEHISSRKSYLYVYGTLISIGYWVIEAAMDTYAFGFSNFMSNLISPPLNESWMRILVIILIMAFTIYTARQNKSTMALLHELHDLSLKDELTGLFNQRGFKEVAGQQLKYAHRSGRRPYILYIDLNRLKEINDTYGHLYGDEAIRGAGEILQNSFREADIIGRLGGDEFGVFVVDAEKQPIDIQLVLDRLQESTTNYNQSSGHPFTVSMSVGYTAYEYDSEKTLEDLLAVADEFMYAQKSSQQNSES